MPRYRAAQIGLAALSLVLLIIAGRALSAANLGALRTTTSCDGSYLGALAAILAAGLVLGIARIVGEIATNTQLRVDLPRMLVASVVPAVLVIVGFGPFGRCGWASPIASWPLVGKALVGAPGSVIIAAAAWALGYGVTLLLRGELAVEQVIGEYERLSKAPGTAWRRRNPLDFDDE